ncbi:protein of unknown function [Capnocytophaga granulosa]|uniref:DUF3872 domain-containing protein n=1 Tax=Capnocytophaga granulosa TaxID=45242 RepID=A0A1H3A289_9FLAO|nr:TraQ conjugal transfer family protein [Capnocytophaga granulosa]EPD30261.1 hypothetical protein HMPREF9331_00902 [Capnocytophaga granulosa ATCC 51502]SDX23745.1 protein of unknown function [Capnocytophaga granulosa]SUX23939.1 DUF based on B. Theta Gene description [Capnocytophaga granulosa]
MKKINQKIVIGLIAMLCVSLFTSCKKELDVQQNFPFEVKVLPVPKSIGKTDTVEIRCELRSPYQYEENRYFIRYFQYEGKGSLRTSPQGEALFANDVYPLASKEAFRLYYTSVSEANQSFSVWISDSFGNEQKLDFEFNVKKE